MLPQLVKLCLGLFVQKSMLKIHTHIFSNFIGLVTHKLEYKALKKREEWLSRTNDPSVVKGEKKGQRPINASMRLAGGTGDRSRARN